MTMDFEDEYECFPNSSAKSPRIKEKTVTSMMNTTPKSAAKKQTSLLQFFSSPKTPKRLASDVEMTLLKEDAQAFEEYPSQQDSAATLAESPIRRTKTNRVYEMVSEGEEDDKKATVNAAAPKSPTIASDFVSYMNDSSVVVPNKTNGSKLLKHSALLESLDSEDPSPIASASADADPDRYGWLVKVRDAEGRYSSDPDYDPRTLYIPKTAWSKFTPFEKQFWEIKSKLLDTVVFFKKGKFYELYENDADIGAREFDLKMIDRINMRMVGVPEATFEMWAARFVAAGYKVARVDQTENSVAKSIREKEGDRSTGSADKIIKRELSMILTAGTLIEPAMIASDLPSYCLCLKEMEVGLGERAGEKRSVFGIAIVDAASGKFQLGDIYQDHGNSSLETLLMQLQPKEVLLEKGQVCAETKNLIKRVLPGVIITEAISEKEFLPAEQIVRIISMERYFFDSSDGATDCWPTVLQEALEGQTPSFLAFGGLFWYLRQLKLDRALLTFKQFSKLARLEESFNRTMILDGPTLLSLDILPSTLRITPSNADPKRGTLFAVLDHCLTSFGRRLLTSWTCHPLRDVVAINDRLDVVEFFMNEGYTTMIKAGDILRALPDLERVLCRIHTGHVKLKDFIAAVDAFDRIRTLKGILSNVEGAPRLVSSIVEEIPEYGQLIEYFINSFDRKVALRDGDVVPFPGVVPEYDSANDRVKSIQDKLEAYRSKQEAVLRVKLQYKDVGKELYQLEVPIEASVPNEYKLMSKTKNTKRYWTPTIKELVQEYSEWEERKAGIQRSIYSNILKQFSSHSSTWRLIVTNVAQFDALQSISTASFKMSEPKCRPSVACKAEGAMVKFTDLRHPCITDPNFIPNDLWLDPFGGEKRDRLLLLTGPNMGGKSTLLRQVCLGVVLAQMGCFIPAAEAIISPVDRIFTRLGANDNIMAGQSTFMVELLDTSKILQKATAHSLIILDELGRGTCTFDGMALAHAVLLNLLRKKKCLTLFATHYRPLAVGCKVEPGVRCKYMNCLTDSKSKRVTFLYKLTDGISPKSYGMNVASMAGLPDDLVEEADEMAGKFDQSLSLSSEEKKEDLRILSRAIIDVLCPL